MNDKQKKGLDESWTLLQESNMETRTEAAKRLIEEADYAYLVKLVKDERFPKNARLLLILCVDRWRL